MGLLCKELRFEAFVAVDIARECAGIGGTQAPVHRVEGEEAFLEKRVVAIPECQGKTDALLVVAEAGQSVFAPAVGPAPSHVVGEILPRITVGAVVFPHRAPLPVAEVRSPLSPGSLACPGFLQSPLFGVHGAKRPLSGGKRKETKMLNGSKRAISGTGS